MLNSEVEIVKGKMGIIAKLEGNLGNLGGCKTGREELPEMGPPGF